MSAATGIDHLCDSRCIVYRANEETQDELQNVVPLWAPLTAPVGLNCRANQNWSGDLQDHGPGEQQSTQRQWFLVAGFNVQERDVIEVVQGPEAPLKLRVMSVTKLTRLLHPETVHHIEVNVEVWTGSLVEEVGDSS